MSLRYKIVALSILPLLLAVTLIGTLVIQQNQQLGEHQAALIEEAILASKRAELKNYVAMALSVIEPLRHPTSVKHDKAAVQQQVLEALSSMEAGPDSYFFVYDAKGQNLMHPRQPELEGKDLWAMVDPQGLPVVQALLESARTGTGFQHYAWRKPSSGEVTDKLAYVVLLEPWGWLLGTGLYLEDVERASQQLRQRVTEGIHTTMFAITGIAVVAVLLVSGVGLAFNVRERCLADTQLQALNRRIIHLQEEERSRVSRELHDGISQLLASIKFQCELASHELALGQAQGMETLGQVASRLGTAIGEVRRISHDLHPSLLDTLGLPAAIGQLSVDFERRCGLVVHHHCVLPPQALPGEVAVALFRIVQEALNNIERHAQAQQVVVDLKPCAKGVGLWIQDDGSGFDVHIAHGTTEGIGLRNIRERAEALGGYLRLWSRPGKTEICVVLPLPGC